MTTFTALKMASATLIALGLTSGAALAGDKKDCKNHKTTAQMSTTSTTAGYASTATTVASTSERSAKKMRVMSFDDALELCTSKNASNLQACIDKKTGKTKPAS